MAHLEVIRNAKDSFLTMGNRSIEPFIFRTPIIDILAVPNIISWVIPKQNVGPRQEKCVILRSIKVRREEGGNDGFFRRAL